MNSKQTIILKRVAPLGWGIVNIPAALFSAISFLNAILSREDKSHFGHIFTLIFVTGLFFALFCLMAGVFNLWLRMVRYPLIIEVEVQANTEEFLKDLKNKNAQRNRERLASLKYRQTNTTTNNDSPKLPMSSRQQEGLDHGGNQE
jgi:predicted membrane protein